MIGTAPCGQVKLAVESHEVAPIQDLLRGMTIVITKGP